MSRQKHKEYYQVIKAARFILKLHPELILFHKSDSKEIPFTAHDL